MPSRDIDEFFRIKQLTNGQLWPETYREIYRSALVAQEGIMLDIGAGQGCGSVCMGLGVQDSGKTGSTVVSIDLGHDSDALQFRNDVSFNGRILRENIRRFGVADTSMILMGEIEEAVDQVFVDADGALDRDFRLFYARLSPGAIVVIDDCLERVETKYLDMTDDGVHRFLNARYRQGKVSKPDLISATPLGKHYTTCRFLSYFLEAGLLERERYLGRTVFCRKPVAGPGPRDVDHEAIQRIRRQIVEDYLVRREKYEKR